MQFIRSKEWWMDRIKNEPDVPIGAGGAYCARQPLSARIWRGLGFGMNNRMDMTDWRCDEEPGFAPGALITDTVVHLDFLDRLRVLIGGRLRIEVSTKTDVLVKKSKSMSAVGVMPPNYPIPGNR
jgi:hypothetical protein